VNQRCIAGLIHPEPENTKATSWSARIWFASVSMVALSRDSEDPRATTTGPFAPGPKPWVCRS
jgi:hypothetical protein